MKIKLIIMLLAAAVLPALSQAQSAGVSVPLMLAPDSERQGFVRIINETDQAGSVRITAVDDAGNAASPIEIDLEAGASLHFNSDDLADGNSAKGIDSIGRPRQGHWRLRVEAAEGVQVMAFVRTRAGFLTAMHDVLPRNDQGRIVARMLNPGSNRNQESSLRLVNTGTNSERVSIRGVDDGSRSAGPVTLTLAAGQARTISAFDLENGAQGLTGSLGDGGGKWRLTIEAGQSVMGMGLLETPTGSITNISTTGVPPINLGSQGNSFANAINLAVGGRISASIDPAGESDYYRIRVSESGTLDVYTSGSLDTRGYLYDSGERELASNDDGGASDGLNFRIQREVDAGTYYARVEAFYRDATGSYTVHAEFDAPPRSYFGSFAVDERCRLRPRLSPGLGPRPRPWSYAYSIDASTRREAENMAVNNCESVSAGYDCCVQESFSTGECLAAAEGVGDSGYYLNYDVASRARLNELRAGVLNDCREQGYEVCSIVISACNSGTAGIAPQARMLQQVAEKHKR